MIQRQDVIRVVLEHNLVELLSLVSVFQVELMNQSQHRNRVVKPGEACKEKFSSSAFAKLLLDFVVSPRHAPIRVHHKKEREREHPPRDQVMCSPRS